MAKVHPITGKLQKIEGADIPTIALMVAFGNMGPKDAVRKYSVVIEEVHRFNQKETPAEEPATEGHAS